MKDFNFIYWLSKIPLTTLWKIYYRIRIVGREHLDFSKPTLIIANHTNAVNDPVVIASSILSGTYFLPRGDVFNSRFKKWLFWQFHMIPIFRKEEGKENLHKNEETFKRVYGLLNDHKSVIIFSEGICVQEKRMRPFRKGTARMAYEFDEKYKKQEDLQFITMGINYHNWNKFGSDVILNIGKPYTLKDIPVSDTDNPARKQLIFKNFAEQRLKELMVIVPYPELDGLEIKAEKIIGEELYKKTPGRSKAERLNKMRQHIGSSLGHYYDASKESCLKFKKETDDYFVKLKESGMRDNSLRHDASYAVTILKLLILFCLSPIIVIGLLGNYLPYKIPIIIATKKIRHVEFFSSVVIVLSALTYFVWYGILFVVIGELLDNYFYSWLLITLSIIIGYLTYVWYKLVKKTLGRLKYFQMKSDEKEKLEELEKRRASIVKQMEACLKGSELFLHKSEVS